MKSVLQRFNPKLKRTSPYPYIVIENCLPQKYCVELEESFPTFEYISRNRTHATKKTSFLSADDALKRSDLPQIWMEFVEFHTSRSFVDEVFNVFSDEINREHSGQPFVSNLNVAVRFTEFAKDANFVTDCQFTVSRHKNLTVVPPHIDDPVELYAALLYFKCAGDTSSGGDLLMYRCKGKPRYIGTRRLRPRQVECAGKVPYRPNQLVMFLNTPLSIHSVSPRTRSLPERRHINIIGESKKALFSTKGRMDNSFFIRTKLQWDRFRGVET